MTDCPAGAHGRLLLGLPTSQRPAGDELGAAREQPNVMPEKCSPDNGPSPPAYHEGLPGRRLVVESQGRLQNYKRR